jgi:uncharacterized membrane protein
MKPVFIFKASFACDSDGSVILFFCRFVAVFIAIFSMQNVIRIFLWELQLARRQKSKLWAPSVNSFGGIRKLTSERNYFFNDTFLGKIIITKFQSQDISLAEN